MNSDDKKLKQLAFDEEETCLNAIETELDELIQLHSGKAQQLDTEIRKWRSYDYDDADRFKIIKRQYDREQQKVEEFAHYKPSPYYLHFEVVIDERDPRSFFMSDSQNDLRVNGRDILLGWRNKLREVAASTSQKQFRIQGGDGEAHTYELRLRRRVKIGNAKLLGVTTEYDSADMSLDGELIDPFLLDVLRDKRRKYILSDIIKTIQHNQNEILVRPADESFIVQGCAGSGKTMILLHRLSYIAYNYDVDFSKYIVLTPHEAFNEHIDDLCNRLELQPIARLTVESYYLRLIKQLTRNDVYIDDTLRGGSRQRTKLDVPTSRFRAETALPIPYLQDMYSTEFTDNIVSLVYGMQDQLLQQLSNNEIQSFFGKWNVELPQLSNCTPYSTYQTISRACAKIRRQTSEAFEAAASFKEEAKDVEERLERTKKLYTGALDIAKPSRDQVIANVAPRFNDMQNKLAELRKQLASERSKLKRAERNTLSLEHERETATDNLRAIEQQLNLMRKYINEGLDNDTLRENEHVRNIANEACEEQARTIEQLQSDMSNAGLFSFGRRRRIRDDLQKAQSGYRTAYEKALDDAVAQWAAAEKTRVQHIITQLELERAAASEIATTSEHAHADAMNNRDEISSQFTEHKATCDSLRTQIDLISPILAAFEREEYPNPEELADYQQAAESTSELKAYIDAYSKLTAGQRTILNSGQSRIETLTMALNEAEANYKEAQASADSLIDMQLLTEIEKLCDTLDIRNCASKLEEVVKTLAAKHDITVSNEVPYRYDLYLKLLLCVLYYGPMSGEGVCICIDEAQDLALVEHELLIDAFGGQATFNLYGDLNQLIYPYKGIRNWKQIDAKISRQYYVLNENYRNTIQITEYCNKRFEMKSTAIGLDGDPVSKLPIKPAIDSLFALKGVNDKTRCAILYKRGLTDLRSAIGNLLGADAAWNRVDNSKISILTVNAAKGLEFDAVIVIENFMSNNELYISMTRALDHLIITNLQGITIDKGEEEWLELPTAESDQAAQNRPTRAPKQKPHDSEPRITSEQNADKSTDVEDPFSDFNF